MQRGDIDRVVALAFEEYCEDDVDLGPSMSTTLEGIARLWTAFRELVTSESGVDEEGTEMLMARTEMEWLRTMIRWGFNERLSIGEGGEDHSVFCVSDERQARRSDTSGDLVAVAEISLKVPNGKTALAIPFPVWLKKLLSWPRPMVPYISNLLVESRARRQGLARILMARCEEQALEWGYSQVFLHVDLNYLPAVRLYESLGYEPVGEDPVFKFDDEPHLRYMKKELRN